MGVTTVQARVFGEGETRQYEFMVDTGSTFLALPQEEIDALGLAELFLARRLRLWVSVVGGEWPGWDERHWIGRRGDVLMRMVS